MELKLGGRVYRETRVDQVLAKNTGFKYGNMWNKPSNDRRVKERYNSLVKGLKKAITANNGYDITVPSLQP